MPAGRLSSIHCVGGMIDQMLDGESRRIDLVAHLHRIAAVDENRRAIGEHDRDAGRAGKAGEPGKPLVAGRHIFVLVTVGARHDETVEAAALELRAQRRKPRRAGALFAAILEGLKWASNIGVIYGCAQRWAMSAGRVPRRSTSVVQPSSVDAALERERPVSGEHGIGLRVQDAGQNDTAAGRENAPDRRREPLERAEQDIGEHEIERGAGMNCRRHDAVRMHEHRCRRRD